MNIDMKKAFFCLALAQFLAYLSQNVQKGECFGIATKTCNATRIADCIPDDDEEFSMESEISRRILAGGPRHSVKSIPALDRGRPFCNRNAYGNCVDKPNKFYNKRPCSYKNLCDRNA